MIKQNNSMQSRYVTAKQAVLNEIRHDIITGVISPGSRFIQSEIAEKLGVSTTPVREALSALASEGLVKIDPHRGICVYEPNLDDLDQIYDLRIIVESYVTKYSVNRISKNVINKAESVFEAMTKDCDFTEWIRLNSQFHEILESSSISVPVLNVLQVLRNYSVLYVALSLDLSAKRRTQSNKEHYEILKAYGKKDVDLAVDLVRSHLETTRIIAREALKKTHEENNKSTSL